MELSARLEKEREIELKAVMKHTTIQKVEVCKSLLLTKTALISQITVKTAIFWNIITILNNRYLFEYIVKCNLFLRYKDDF